MKVLLLATLLAVGFLMVDVCTSAPAVVKLSLVIPEGHKITDVNLRFENHRRDDQNAEGSSDEEDDEPRVRPSLDKGPEGKIGGKEEFSPLGRHVAGRDNMVETFPAATAAGRKAFVEGHNTINRVIKLPAGAGDLGPIRK